MPIYEYSCQACGQLQEIFQKVSDNAPDKCPSCQSGPLVKQISKTGFILKGSGWYVTDFRDSGKKPTKSSDAKETDSTGESKDSASTPPQADKAGGHEAQKDKTGAPSESTNSAKKEVKADTSASSTAGSGTGNA